jgi:hypothetical protein
MAAVVYALCAATSLLCVGLLLRAWIRTRVPLLLWCLICFAGLALNNILLFLDKVVITGADLSVWRALPAAAGVAALVYGLVWQADE